MVHLRGQTETAGIPGRDFLMPAGSAYGVPQCGMLLLWNLRALCREISRHCAAIGRISWLINQIDSYGHHAEPHPQHGRNGFAQNQGAQDDPKHGG
jgi:hypothetical protein